MKSDPAKPLHKAQVVHISALLSFIPRCQHALILFPPVLRRRLKKMGEQLAALALTKDELENTLGVFFIGYVFSSVIYGFNFFQTWRYSSLYSSDPIPLKAFVSFSLERPRINFTLTPGFIGGDNLILEQSPWFHMRKPRVKVTAWDLTESPATQTDDWFGQHFNVEIILAAISIFLVQRYDRRFYLITQLTGAHGSYYTYRFWLVHKRASVSVLLGTITLGALALGIEQLMCTVDVLILGKQLSSHNFTDRAQNREFETLGNLSNRLQISFRQGLTLLAGLILAVMQWQLPLQKPQVNRLDGEQMADWFDKLLLYAIRRFSVANLVQLGYFVVFAILPRTAYWLPFHLSAQKLYINAFLNEMNSRPVPRRRRYGEFGDTFPRRSFVNPGLRNDETDIPDSDNKTTIQLQDHTEDFSGQQSSHIGSSKLDVPIGTEEEISVTSWDPLQKQDHDCHPARRTV
ncbi:hypothetical protein D9756_004742 [Leucocoprinus leucothites]|uniref:Uncharacterized protein n=1 Tax=Leucocoprinus leucothites TaxID=201217 RepID=A0A8H5LKI1_9AGAR|nr:hypothetical protein D9756_004742 [Leucoagaricus leucothites]